MSELILLPGNEKYDEKWIQRVGARLENLFDSTKIQYYRHWENEQELIDLDHEIEQLTDFMRGKDDYYIFGKSMGSVLAIKGIQEGKLNPRKSVFCGLPVSWGRPRGIIVNDIIEGYKYDTVFVQNEEDPYLNGIGMEEYLERRNVTNSKVVLLKGSGHDYDDLDKFYSIMRNIVRERA